MPKYTNLLPLAAFADAFVNGDRMQRAQIIEQMKGMASAASQTLSSLTQAQELDLARQRAEQEKELLPLRRRIMEAQAGAEELGLEKGQYQFNTERMVNNVLEKIAGIHPQVAQGLQQIGQAQLQQSITEAMLEEEVPQIEARAQKVRAEEEITRAPIETKKLQMTVEDLLPIQITKIQKEIELLDKQARELKEPDWQKLWADTVSKSDFEIQERLVQKGFDSARATQIVETKEALNTYQNNIKQAYLAKTQLERGDNQWAAIYAGFLGKEPPKDLTEEVKEEVHKELDKYIFDQMEIMYAIYGTEVGKGILAPTADTISSDIQKKFEEMKKRMIEQYQSGQEKSTKSPLESPIPEAKTNEPDLIPRIDLDSIEVESLLKQLEKVEE